jgi:hypothetical protein
MTKSLSRSDDRLSKFFVLLWQNVTQVHGEAPSLQHLDRRRCEKIAQLQTVRNTGCKECAEAPKQTAERLNVEQGNLQQQSGQRFNELSSVWSVSLAENVIYVLVCTSIAGHVKLSSP